MAKYVTARQAQAGCMAAKMSGKQFFFTHEAKVRKASGKEEWVRLDADSIEHAKSLLEAKRGVVKVLGVRPMGGSGCSMTQWFE